MLNRRTDYPEVDLSTGTYDELETSLSKTLGIKVCMVRDWDMPKTCSGGHRDGEWHYSSDDPEQQRLLRLDLEWHRAAYVEKSMPDHENPVLDAQINSLSAYLEGRDEEFKSDGVNHGLYEEELKAFVIKGHITLRDSNACPPKTVIINDPGLDLEALKSKLLPSTFNSAWDEDQKREINTLDFAENFDIDPDDYRAYEAARRVAHSLQNQTSFEFEPFWTNRTPYFTTIIDRVSNKEDQSPYYGNMGYKQVCRFIEPEYMMGTSVGIKDEKFFEKLRQLKALGFLRFQLDPKEFFARLSHEEWGPAYLENLTDADINEMTKEIRNKFRSALKERVVESKSFDGLRAEMFASNDLRVSVPLFRELKDSFDFEGKSYEKAANRFVEAVWQAAEHYLPTLAAAEVPELREGGEPKSEKRPGLEPPKPS